VDSSFIVEVIQGMVVALGLALAGGNAFALWHSRRARRRYETELDQWRRAGKSKKKGGSGGDTRGPKPEEPQKVRAAAAAVNIFLGLAMALVGVASLTFNWVK